MSDIVWAIKPERESLADLSRRMRQQADELFVPAGIALRFHAPPAGAAIKLGIDVRRDVLLFFKEAVTNVARHAACTSVAIDLAVDASRLTLVVADDGGGFDTGAVREGQGLRSLERRAGRLGAALSITSAPGRGTVVSLGVPL
jgi:signal transduction histidine kinase